jgi:hypothetical protein
MSELPVKAEPIDDGRKTTFGRRLWNSIKRIGSLLFRMIVFEIILVDVLLAIATILYAVDGNAGWIFVSWIALALIAFQFVRLTESHRSKRGAKELERWAIVKLILTALVGAITGAVIWPIFDDANGLLIGISFGSLFGLTIELFIELATLN